MYQSKLRIVWAKVYAALGVEDGWDLLASLSISIGLSLLVLGWLVTPNVPMLRADEVPLNNLCIRLLCTKPECYEAPQRGYLCSEAPRNACAEISDPINCPDCVCRPDPYQIDPCACEAPPARLPPPPPIASAIPRVGR
jgi:hypothetical protein